MANKHQVLELLAKGLTPQEVAKELGCSDAYVRATRKRDEDPSYYKQFAAYTRGIKTFKRRYHTDAEFRRKHNEASLRNYYKRKAENRA